MGGVCLPLHNHTLLELSDFSDVNGEQNHATTMRCFEDCERSIDFFNTLGKRLENNFFLMRVCNPN